MKLSEYISRMREIKFRAWNESNKELCKDSFAVTNEGKVIVFHTPSSIWETSDFCVTDQLTIIQYTGLKDKNGTEIYEGDIVENTTQTVYLGDKYEVVWNKNYAGYQLMSNGFTSNIPLIQNFMSYEVIGNVFENPDLLEG